MKIPEEQMLMNRFDVASPVLLLAGQAIGHFSDYRVGMDPHDAAGIFNRAWCLLKNKPGWNYIMAFEVQFYLSKHPTGCSVSISSNNCSKSLAICSK